LPKGRTAGLHPPSRPNLTSRRLRSQDTRGRTTLKSLPSRAQRPRGVEVRTTSAGRRVKARRSEIRSSPVYAGHAIKPLRKLKSLAAGACSLGQDRGHPANRKTPARIPSNATGSVPFEQSIRMDRKGMISYCVGFSECAHRRASNGQHVRKRLFNESFPVCQA
jgi:hypothetical protein